MKMIDNELWPEVTNIMCFAWAKQKYKIQIVLIY